MFTISVTELIVLLVMLPLFGGLVGYVIAGDRMRRAAGGRSPAELREEIDAYRADVTAHFQQTADLLGGMTEQYRAVYTHMARGAETLCESVEPGPRLEQLRAELLEAQAEADRGESGSDAPKDAPADAPAEDAAAPERAPGDGAARPESENRTAA